MSQYVNIYRNHGEWCYAVWIDREYDHSDTLGLPDEASDQEAETEARRQFPGAEIQRVEDLVLGGQNETLCD